MRRMMIATSLFVVFGGLLAFGLASSCSDIETSTSSDDTDTSSHNESLSDVPLSRPGELAVGGLPSAEEFAGAQPLTVDEASFAADSINEVNQSLPMEIAIDQDGTALALQDDQSSENGDESGSAQNSDEGAGGLIQIGAAFGEIYDMVTGGAGCAYGLVTRDAAGNPVPLRQVEGKPLYYVDGWAALGLGDDGAAACPERAQVDGWVARNFDGSDGPANDSEEFYLPARVVLFKAASGKIWWNLVFMPGDYLAALAAENKFFERFKNLEGDFSIYRGNHAAGDEIGQGEGLVTLDFNRLAAMITTFENLESEPMNLVTQEDDGPPQGVIRVTYNLNESPQVFTTTFSEDFSFGDGGPPLFVPGVPVVNKRAGAERYLGFAANETFGKPDAGDPNDEGLPVRFCNNTAYGDEENMAGPFISTHFAEVAPGDYLERSSRTFFQMIWASPAPGERVTEYAIRSTSTAGGGFIYGPVRFETYAKSTSSLNAVKVWAPLCDTLTPEVIAQGNADTRAYLIANEGYSEERAAEFSYVNDDGVQILVFEGFPGQSAGEVFFASEESIAPYVPTWTTFSFLNKGEE